MNARDRKTFRMKVELRKKKPIQKDVMVLVPEFLPQAGEGIFFPDERNREKIGRS